MEFQSHNINWIVFFKAFNHTKLHCKLSKWRIKQSVIRLNWTVPQHSLVLGQVFNTLLLLFSRPYLNLDDERDSTRQKFIRAHAAPRRLNRRWSAASWTLVAKSRVIPSFEQQRETEGSTRRQRRFDPRRFCLQWPQFPWSSAFPVSALARTHTHFCGEPTGVLLNSRSSFFLANLMV